MEMVSKINLKSDVLVEYQEKKSLRLKMLTLKDT